MEYKFFRPDTQSWITTPEEAWGWEVHYEDGQILKQFGDDGVFHQFAEIDQERLAIFKMVSRHTKQSYSLLFTDPSMRLIHFYRNTILAAGTENEQRIRLYCFGYQKKLGTKTYQVIMAITPNNQLIVTEDKTLL